MELGDWLRVDMKAGKPLFDQLRTQVIDGVREGALPPGTRLPTVRDLAGQLGVAVNTVARAYRELETSAHHRNPRALRHFHRPLRPDRCRDGGRGPRIRRVARGLGLDKADAVRYIEAVPDE